MVANCTDPRARGRIRMVGAVACMVVPAAALPACSSEQSPGQAATGAASTITTNPTSAAAELLYGTWDIGSGGSFQTLGRDGTFYVVSKTYLEDGTVAVTREGAEPYDWGTYTFDGSRVTLDGTADEAALCPNTRGVYTVTFVDVDTLRYELIQDDCSSRRKGIVAKQHTRVEVQ